MNKGIIWMLHSVESDSNRTADSAIFRRLTVSPEALEAEIVQARAEGWTFVSGSKFLSDKHDGVEHRNVLITIDDGFRNIYTDAFPLFRKLNVPFVFYVSTGLIEQGFRICPYAQLDGLFAICDLARRRGLDPDRCFRRYRRLRRWFPFLDGRWLLSHILGGDVDFDRYFREAVVTPDELREMSDSGLCEVGSHTDRHVHVDRCWGIERELTVSKRKIEDWTGRSCETFSFPYGHVDARALSFVRRHFTWATRDVHPPADVVTSESDDYLLPRRFFPSSLKRSRP